MVLKLYPHLEQTTHRTIWAVFSLGADNTQRYLSCILTRADNTDTALFGLCLRLEQTTHIAIWAESSLRADNTALFKLYLYLEQTTYSAIKCWTISSRGADNTQRCYFELYHHLEQTTQSAIILSYIITWSRQHKALLLSLIHIWRCRRWP